MSLTLQAEFTGLLCILRDRPSSTRTRSKDRRVSVLLLTGHADWARGKGGLHNHSTPPHEVVLLAPLEWVSNAKIPASFQRPAVVLPGDRFYLSVPLANTVVTFPNAKGPKFSLRLNRLGSDLGRLSKVPGKVKASVVDPPCGPVGARVDLQRGAVSLTEATDETGVPLQFVYKRPDAPDPLPGKPSPLGDVVKAKLSTTEGKIAIQISGAEKFTLTLRPPVLKAKGHRQMKTVSVLFSSFPPYPGKLPRKKMTPLEHFDANYELLEKRPKDEDRLLPVLINPEVHGDPPKCSPSGLAYRK